MNTLKFECFPQSTERPLKIKSIVDMMQVADQEAVISNDKLDFVDHAIGGSAAISYASMTARASIAMQQVFTGGRARSECCFTEVIMGYRIDLPDRDRMGAGSSLRLLSDKVGRHAISSLGA